MARKVLELIGSFFCLSGSIIPIEEGNTMQSRFVSIGAALAVGVCLGAFSAPAKSVPIAFNFQFEVPDFAEPELSPLVQLFSDNAITGVSGLVAWDTDDAEFVTSNFILMSNIDSLFDQTPGELVFAPTGNLNQIRSWRVGIGGMTYILELTGLDDTDLLPNRWFGGRLSDGENVFGLTDAGGGLTPTSVSEPTTLALMGAGLLTAIGFGRKRRQGMQSNRTC